jgi:hypothetical protein
MTVRARRGDPDTQRLAVPTLLVLAGFGTTIWAYVGSSGERIVAQQIPWIVSGGLTGAALIVLGVTLAALHLRRRNEAVEIVALDMATRQATEVAALLHARKRRP